MAEKELTNKVAEKALNLTPKEFKGYFSDDLRLGEVTKIINILNAPGVGLKSLEDILLKKEEDLMKVRLLGESQLNHLKYAIKNISKKYFKEEGVLHLQMSEKEINALKHGHQIKNIFFEISSRNTALESDKKIYFIEVIHTDDQGQIKKLPPINAGTNIESAKKRLSSIRNLIQGYQSSIGDKPIQLETCKKLVAGWKSHEAMNKLLNIS